MKILMLGWEYPPVISGGLGTATEGLVQALISMGHKITLVLPNYPHRLQTKNLTIVSPENPFDIAKNKDNNNIDISLSNTKLNIESSLNETYKEISEIVEKKSIETLNSHYNYVINKKELTSKEKNIVKLKFNEYQNYLHELKLNSNNNFEKKDKINYNFSANCNVNEKCYILGLLALDILEKDADYQVIHAHDWMSFTAAKMIKEIYNIPLVVHIHSTELDRSGEIDNNKEILQIEQIGIQLSDLVITVSEFTKHLIVDKFHTPADKIKVVYNANNSQHLINSSDPENTLHNVTNAKLPVVTFVGRITFQKGPSYFVFAAEKVLKFNPNVIFKVVGTGDLLPAMKQLTWELGIDKHFQFEGFLNAQGVQKTLQDSDIFIMPSVSEPFGIVALEAIAQNIPVVISKQSGVSEVLNHALKVDFWDTDLIADRIISLLKYQSVRSEMIENSLKDLDNRTWLNSAKILLEAYKEIN
ncbi:glycosyltransferase [Pigmentibacter sp. JX0631]|uniref:glycosyltransferase n=1 Tax=Pigmentibacter sp. JX0631 TaxID=2976982 RepID=UPI0024690715|nr:glycosyltransferase [Pigmentibacter sp. JX0631]WGL60126.1 glycosyltransferase [Pigmentibacter sp. JX0631]